MVRAGGGHRLPLFGLILVKRIYNTGKITISGAIAEKYGTSTKNIISLIMIYALLLVNVGNYVSGAAAISTVLKSTYPWPPLLPPSSVPSISPSAA